MKNRFKAVLGRLMDEGKNASQRGFTLIELLVVVLIIGILASIALPQYERAVEKSRVTEAKTTIRAIATAIKANYLAKGTVGGATFDELDLTFTDKNGTPATGPRFYTKNWFYNIASNFSCRDNNGNYIFQGISAINRKKQYEIYYCENQGFVCNAWGSNKEELCKSAGFTNKKTTQKECLSVSECYAE